MHNVAIVCEYNPFHNGHAQQIKKIRELYPDSSVIALMSPNFVQRGEAALFDKYTRAEAGVLGGCDLVLSLPCAFSLLSAEGFAEAGVRLAEALGIDILCFGAEDSEDTLLKIAEVQLDNAFNEKVLEKCKLSPSLSLQRAGEDVIREALGESFAEAVRSPNNILALEYVKSIIRLNCKIKPLFIKRKGEGYKSLEHSSLPSATFVRQTLLKGLSSKNLVPEECRALYEERFESGFWSKSEKMESIIRASILSKTSLELEVPFGSRELTRRFLKNIRACTTLDEAVSATVTQRFTRSRITRSLILSLFSVPHNRFMHEEPQYTLVLAMRENGRRFLARVRKNLYPIILTKTADYTKYESNSRFREQFELERRADEIWALTCAVPVSPDVFIKTSPKVIESETI